MCLHEVGIVPRTEVVRDHKTSKLIDAEVFIRKKRGVCLMSPPKKTSKNVSGNHDCDVT